MVKNMKVALCMSGGLRCYKDTFNHLKKFVLDKLDYDLFFYGTENKEGADQNLIDFATLYSPKKCIVNTVDSYDVLLHEIFKINDLQLRAGGFASKLKNMIPMFFNIMQCNYLKNEYEQQTGIKYDVVIRLRPDVFFIREFNEEELISAKKGLLVIPDPWNFCGGITDIFAMSNSPVMNLYSKIFESLKECYYKNIFHPETITKYHIDKNSLPIHIVTRHHEMEYPESLDLNNPDSLFWDRSKGQERNLKYSFDK